MAIAIKDGEYLDLVEAALIVGLHPESLRRLVRYGKVRALKLERGLYFTAGELEQAFSRRNTSS